MKIHVKNTETNEVMVRDAEEDPFGALILDMYLDGIANHILVDLHDDDKKFTLTQTTRDNKTGGKTKKDLTFIWDYVNKVDDRTYEPPVVKSSFEKLCDSVKDWFQELLEEESMAQKLDKQKEKDDKTV